MWPAPRRRSRSRRAAGLALATAVALPLALISPPARALPVEPQEYLQPLPPGGISKLSRASLASGLAPGACLAQLARRKLAVKRWKGFALGVATPVRLAGPIAGVRFVSPGGKSPYGVLDCRLAIALSELAEVLVRHGVVEVRIDNMYRPRAHLPGKKKASQHSYGLAADITRFRLADGEELSVERDFMGTLGEAACGAEARVAGLEPKAIQLRNLICDVARSEVFHHILTPNHNAAHRDHFHLDIARGARQRIIE